MTPPLAGAAAGAIVAAVLLVVLGATVGFFVVLLNVMRRTVRRDTEEAVTSLRDKVVRLFERAEALKTRRERLLGAPGLDVAPPAGRTSRAHEEARKKLDELLEGWASLEQKLETIRALVNGESAWGRAKLDDARALAEEKETISDAASAAAAEAERIMKELEDAPPRAVAALDRAREACRAMPGAQRPAFSSRLEEIDRGLRADPLGTAERAELLETEISRASGAAPLPSGPEAQAFAPPREGAADRGERGREGPRVREG